MGVAVIVGICGMLVVMWSILYNAYVDTINATKKTIWNKCTYSSEEDTEGNSFMSALAIWKTIWMYACYTTGVTIFIVLLFLICI